MRVQTFVLQCGLDWLRPVPAYTNRQFDGINNGEATCYRSSGLGRPILHPELLLGQGEGRFNADIKKYRRFPERHSSGKPSAYPSRRH